MKSSQPEKTPSSAVDGERRRLPYEPPALIEWGSLLELTRGPTQQTEDFPMTGGSGTG